MHFQMYQAQLLPTRWCGREKTHTTRVRCGTRGAGWQQQTHRLKFLFWKGQKHTDRNGKSNNQANPSPPTCNFYPTLNPYNLMTATGIIPAPPPLLRGRSTTVMNRLRVTKNQRVGNRSYLW